MEEGATKEEATTEGIFFLPSLLSPNFRLARKMVVVRREDGFEKRRVWRCGRCGVGVGYEILGGGEGKGGREDGEGEGERDRDRDRDRGRVMYLLEGGLREMEEMGMGG